MDDITHFLLFSLKCSGVQLLLLFTHENMTSDDVCVCACVCVCVCVCVKGGKGGVRASETSPLS